MWILCNTNKAYDMQHFKDAAISLGIDLKIIDPTRLQILNTDTISFFYNQKPIDIPSHVLNWNGCMNGKLEEQIEAALKTVGCQILNQSAEINAIQDKFRWQIETKLKTANSLKIHSSELLANVQLIESYFDYPLILKSDTGSLGLGVYKAENRANLRQIIEIISLLDKSFKVHIEQYINYTNDVRMYIIGNEYYLMERIASDDFRANVAQSASVKSLSKTQVTDAIFNQIRACYSSLVLGVDILFKDNSYIICEINSAPGFTGIEQVHDVDIAKEILSAATNKSL